MLNMFQFEGQLLHSSKKVSEKIIFSRAHKKPNNAKEFLEFLIAANYVHENNFRYLQ